MVAVGPISAPRFSSTRPIPLIANLGDVGEVEPFENAEALGRAWHTLIGYDAATDDDEQVERVLRDNPEFLRRTAASIKAGLTL